MRYFIFKVIAYSIGYKQYFIELRGMCGFTWAKTEQEAKEHVESLLPGDDTSGLLPNWLIKIRGW